MSYTKTDMLSHKIIEILKEHSDEKHPLTQQQICGYLEEKLGIKPNRKTVAQHLKSIIGDESCNVFIADNDNDDDDDKSDKNTSQIFTTPLTSPLRNMSFWQTASYTHQCSLRTM